MRRRRKVVAAPLLALPQCAVFHVALWKHALVRWSVARDNTLTGRFWRFHPFIRWCFVLWA